MSELERPDLSQVEPKVKAYIEALEAELLRLTQSQPLTPVSPSPAETSEPPTSINVVTLSRDNIVKRSPRHLYSRQRRGGMGVFDLETKGDDFSQLLVLADESQHVLLFSDLGRAFRLPVNALDESPVRSRGESLAKLLPFRPQESVVAVLPDSGGEFVLLASQRGWVRRIRSNYLGPSLIPGMSFHDVKEGGPLTAACWTQGNNHLFMATRQGKGIRFVETQVPGRGCLGMRVEIQDEIVAVTAVRQDSGVFLVSDDGKGTIRLMSGFSANKSPGGGGKTALKTDRLVDAIHVTERDDIFIVSRLNKIIRFRADEIPAKTGVVQGVSCISLRADEVTAVASCVPDAALADEP